MTSAEQIVRELLECDLLAEESLAESCHALEKQGRAVTGPSLLSFLTAEGKLTPFQAAEVLHGRGSRLLLGNYLVLSKLGEGGMGTVYKALHRRMQRVVAVKVIRKEIATAAFIDRFRHEIQMLARLNHPHVVIAYDADNCPFGDFLVMEYVEGADLAEVLKRTGSLSLPETISTVRQAALALGYAHGQGIVHRDVKPANLLRDMRGAVKVVDLGLARASEWEGARPENTRSRTVEGTVDYMAPEQVESPLTVDRRSDIYSLGCTMFHLLTGGPLFPRTDLYERLAAHRSEAPPKLTSVVNEVSPELDAIFQRMVAKSPDDRFSSMEQLVEMLDHLDRPPGAERVTKSAEPLWVPERTTALVVEESRLQARLIQNVLKELGLTDIHCCQSGQEALRRLTVMSPTLLLSSMQLSDMSGLELAARMRDTLRWLSTSIVLMSSDPWSPVNRSAAQQLGGICLLQKPFDVARLREGIESTLKTNALAQRMLAGLAELQVLVVDDSSVARRHQRETLSSLGFARFTEADDGATAVPLLNQAKFDLVVTDYNMPRMDGRQLITYIRQESTQREVPIIMVTTEFNPQKLAPIYQLGVSAICNKNFDRELVQNIVIQLFA